MSGQGFYYSMCQDKELALYGKVCQDKEGALYSKVLGMSGQGFYL